MLTSKDSLEIQRHIYENERMEKDIPCKQAPKESTASRRKETIKIRAKISEKENRNTIEKNQ